MRILTSMAALCTSRWVESQVAHTATGWKQSSVASIPRGPRYTPREQHRREQAYDRALAEVEHEAQRAPLSSRHGTQDRLIASFARFAAAALGLEDAAIELLTQGFLPAGTALAQWAHRFDPTLSHADIAQACRNGWTACGLQPLLGEHLRMTPSILAYSLLYPYSDNYLDERLIAQQDKLRFSGRLRARLQGEPLPPLDPHECRVWQMIGLIEQQYPRLRYPAVFDSLLAIHAAQEQSMAQLQVSLQLSDEEILRISCAKGGTSVWADACLVRGHLTAPESEFAFAWGVLLQLGDDLQDLHEDLLRGSATVFTAAVQRGEPLDGLVMQLLQFSAWVGAHMRALPHADETFRALLRMSWRSLVLMAVAYAPEFFTPVFLRQLEPSSPFRFGFLRSRRETLRGKAGLFERLFQVVLDDTQDDPHNLGSLPLLDAIPQPV